jgi:AraC family transcriptional regulator, regulatory protein of adaptative response / methylated-DNA-[protein]-cysteine methyltransferase
MLSRNDIRWKAIASRDSKGDEKFFYGVKTTGVYCRPDCRSRQPRRENVEFFDSPAAAEEAGYRACQRCRPNTTRQRPHLDIVLEACRSIEKSQSKLSLDQLAAAAGMSRFHFQRIFKSIVGITPKQYAIARRFHQFRRQLGSAGSVTDAIYKSGFGSGSRAYEKSAANLGMTPKSVRDGGVGTTIQYATTRTSLGPMLVAATERGICAIFFGAGARDELAKAFPQARLVGGGEGFSQYIEMISQLVEQPGKSFDLPLDIRGTAFQQLVWQKIREIPPGATLTYTELARRIGNPKAVRAVASACAANKLAVAIPCHRVINSSGGLSGYRWGKARKRRLLENEAALTAKTIASAAGSGTVIHTAR